MVSTVLPRNTSTDGFVTTANQTKPVWENKRLAYNDWLRAGAPIDPVKKVVVEIGTAGAILTGQAGHPLSQYNGTNVIETADTVETARNSGLWKVPTRTVADAAITAAAATLTSATANFTAADVGKAVTIQGAGTSGAAYVSVIKTFTNATTVVLADNAVTTVSAASAAIDTWTTDGVHPSTRGHQAMAAALNPALITL
jgi:lysophospholipase L1-like esterase